jgi:hypothetical protein
MCRSRLAIFRNSHNLTLKAPRVPKIRKKEAKIKIKKQYRHLTQLAERFKTSTISWDFVGFTHGRVTKVTDLQFIGRFESRLKLKLSKFHENFCITIFWPLKHFAIIFWLLNTCWSCIIITIFLC